MRYFIDPDAPRVRWHCCPVGRCLTHVPTENGRCEVHRDLTVSCRTCLRWSRKHRELCRTCGGLGWVTVARDNWAAETGALHDAWNRAGADEARQEAPGARSGPGRPFAPLEGATVEPDDDGEGA